MTIYNPKLRKQMTEDAFVQAKSLGHKLTPFYLQETLESDSRYLSAPEHRLLAVCEQCGCLVELPNGNQEALYLSCEPDANTAAEGQAQLISLSPQLLYNRLAEAAGALPEGIAPFFEPGQFDTGRFNLLSNDGIWCLQWKLRRAPDEPIGPDNPQSSRGRVELYRWVNERDLLPVTYRGPELDPNISTDERRRRVKILYPGEEGIAHRIPKMYDDRWVFRRLDGTRAYTVPAHYLQFHKREVPLTRNIEENLLALQAPGTSKKEGDKTPLFVHEPSPVGMESS